MVNPICFVKKVKSRSPRILWQDFEAKKDTMFREIANLEKVSEIAKICTSSFSIKKLHRVADLWPRHVKWGRPVKNAVHISNLYRPRFWQVDSPEVLLIDGPLLFSIWMASGPHVAMIFYPPFSTTHFFLLISLAYTYAYHRIVISQQRWDPEQHFDVKKQGWSFDKILSTRDSKYMQHFYWNGGSIYLQPPIMITPLFLISQLNYIHF